jgi:hypothetical protein
MEPLQSLDRVILFAIRDRFGQFAGVTGLERESIIDEIDALNMIGHDPS